MTPNRKPPSGPKAPRHLQPATRKWWEAVAAEYQLESHHERLLSLAAESWDRCQEARKILDAQGMTYADRFGAPRARPEVAIERDSRVAFARLLRELGLDIEPPADPARPTRLRGQRW
jgi:P27 family predicted phage terminase small subunit